MRVMLDTNILISMVVAKIATTTQHRAMAGKTRAKDTQFYNPDAIISVGYGIWPS